MPSEQFAEDMRIQLEEVELKRSREDFFKGTGTNAASAADARRRKEALERNYKRLVPLLEASREFEAADLKGMA